MLFCRPLIFLNQLFEKLFQEYNQSLNSLDPDQARHFVWPDLGPNCLQKLSADRTSRQSYLFVCFCHLADNFYKLFDTLKVFLNYFLGEKIDFEKKNRWQSEQTVLCQNILFNYQNILVCNNNYRSNHQTQFLKLLTTKICILAYFGNQNHYFFIIGKQKCSRLPPIKLCNYLAH